MQANAYYRKTFARDYYIYGKEEYKALETRKIQELNRNLLESEGKHGRKKWKDQWKEGR